MKEESGVDQERSTARTEASVSEESRDMALAIELAAADLELATGFDRDRWRYALNRELSILLANTREEIYAMVDWMKKKHGVIGAQGQARKFALDPDTVRGRDFWFAVTELLGGDVSGWREAE